MKKTIIAGAASLALAAMPVVGVFAATSMTDTITANVSDSCTFARTAGEGTYATTLLPNAMSENFASSIISVTCSADQDIDVSATFTDLVSGENSIAYSSDAVAEGVSSWNAAKGQYSATATSLANDGALFDLAGEAGKQYDETVWYSVATSVSQVAGAYKGYATYTLAEN